MFYGKIAMSIATYKSRILYLMHSNRNLEEDDQCRFQLVNFKRYYMCKLNPIAFIMV